MNDTTNTTHTNDFHFFAASFATWATTNDKRDLQALIKLMDREGYTYNLYLVPLHHAENYSINFYQPQVEGTMHLGTFESKKSTRKAA
jgi:hypothetical protein